MYSAFRIILLSFVLVVIVAGLSAYWTFFKLTPSPDHTIEFHELQNEVTVHWSDEMIPHVMAENESDAILVTGYLHARDRLWQMTRYQYKLEGLHSREIDETLLNLDKFYLTMSFADRAREAYNMLSDREQQLLQAYASGINLFIEKNRDHLPIEFTLSDSRPVPWKPWHTIGVQLLWGWQHHHAFWSKPALIPIHETRDESVTRALTGSNVPHNTLFGNFAPVIDSTVYSRLLHSYLNFTEPVYPEQTIRPGSGFAISHSQGSLNAVSVSRELPLTIPDQGYEMTISVGDITSTGITIPGFPVLIYGQNDRVAWAIQPVPADDGDFYAGRLFDEPVQEPVDWKHDATIYDRLSDNITINRHILELKDGAEYQVIIRKANGHPVVAFSETYNTYLAFEWAGFTPPVDFGAYLDLSRSRSVSDIESATARISTPAIQILATDINGVAGRWFGGHTLHRTHPLKLRTADEVSNTAHLSTLFPSQTESAGDPVFFLEKRPTEILPDQYVSIYFSPWERSGRYLELFDETSPEYLSTVISDQWDNDTYSVFAATLTPVITQILEDEAENPKILNPFSDVTLPYLQNWNFEYRSNETAASIFELFLIEAAKRLYEPFLGQTGIKLLFTTPQVSVTAVSNLIMNPEVWPDAHPLSHNEWITSSMSNAALYLMEHFGEEPHDWQWGNVVQGQFKSPFHARTIDQKRAARLAERNLYRFDDLHITGTSHTIHAASINFNNPFNLASATTLKRTMILQPDPEVHSVLSTGQSGNIFSDQFDNQFRNWKYGNKYTRPFNGSTVSESSYVQHFLPGNL